MKLKQVAFYFVIAACFGLSFGLTSFVKKTDREGFAKTLADFRESVVEKKNSLFQSETENSNSLEQGQSSVAPKSLKEAVADLNRLKSQKDCTHAKCEVVKKKTQTTSRDQKLNLGSLKVDQETASSDPQATAKLRDMLIEDQDEHGGITHKIDSKNFEKSAN